MFLDQREVHSDHKFYGRSLEDAVWQLISEGNQEFEVEPKTWPHLVKAMLPLGGIFVNSGSEFHVAGIKFKLQLQ